jgi:hypothetical protein
VEFASRTTPTCPTGRALLGDYCSGVDVRACGIYCAYIAKFPGQTGSAPGVYVSVVNVGNMNCEPDPNCYANCDGSTQQPVLNVADFTCFLSKFAEGTNPATSCDTPITGHLGIGPCYANCDGSTTVPFLNVADFSCFLTKFAVGCQ